MRRFNCVFYWQFCKHFVIYESFPNLEKNRIQNLIHKNFTIVFHSCYYTVKIISFHLNSFCRLLLPAGKRKDDIIASTYVAESVSAPATIGYGAPLATPRDSALFSTWDGAPPPLPSWDGAPLTTRDGAPPAMRSYVRPPAVPLISLNGGQLPVSTPSRPLPTGA
jgi:hypothetical protein